MKLNDIQHTQSKNILISKVVAFEDFCFKGR